MKVEDLKKKTSVDEITLEITEKGEPKNVRAGSLKVCNYTGKDDTGEVIVALWNDDIDKVNEGDTIQIKKGWVREFNNKLQISPGRYGSFEVLDE
ncbi:MAG: hypothetical protein ACOCRX_03595 [Candidatus Woesearchaeota archaeon]